MLLHINQFQMQKIENYLLHKTWLTSWMCVYFCFSFLPHIWLASCHVVRILLCVRVQHVSGSYEKPFLLEIQALFRYRAIAIAFVWHGVVHHVIKPWSRNVWAIHFALAHTHHTDGRTDEGDGDDEKSKHPELKCVKGLITKPTEWKID